MRKELRLKKARDFGKVFREGRRYFSPHFALYVRKNSLSVARLGVSISKAHFRLATRRNRLRRVAKALFQEKIIPDCKGKDFVLKSRRRCNAENFNSVLQELKNFLLGLKR